MIKLLKPENGNKNLKVSHRKILPLKEQQPDQ